MACTPLTPPKIVAIATDKYLTQTYQSFDPSLPGPAPKYGQDFTYTVQNTAPDDYSVGKTEAELKPKMEALLGVFASGDKSGMARRLFDKFLAKQKNRIYFDDASMNAAAEGHENIKHFIKASLGVHLKPPPGKKRIHQALQDAGWDIKKLVAPTDLGVPAFNVGDKVWQTGDFTNGLGLMINGVQHVYVIAKGYDYDAKKKQYCIKLEYRFYDVFGLDDDDLKEYGAKSDGMFASKAAVGITAWWQLQHQFGYAPLVTRIVITKEYVVNIP
jgi:hypothetical protein